MRRTQSRGELELDQLGQRQQRDAPAAELYSRCAKSLVAVGETDPAARDIALHFTLELVAEENPYRLPAGSVLPVRLFYRDEPLQGALVMAVAFGLGALVPLLPYLFLDPTQGLWASLIGTGAVLFAIGVAKSRWTRRGWLRSGIEILLLGAFAGVAGYLFGDLLPAILGAPSGG